jgi:aryl-alcohol dehydrogenase-like predicted oxidoreductase
VTTQAQTIDFPRLGLGCGGIGDARVGDRDAEALVLGAIDLGVTLFDAARSYGLAEERLGRYVGSRRDSVLLSTKGGYGADGAGDWTPLAIERGIDQALGRLRTDRIDVFHLHSCPLDVLVRDDLLDALSRAREAGKIRIAAYSGDNEALVWAVGSRRFGSVQCSVNVFDQVALDEALPLATERGVHVISKRPLGNAAWDRDDDVYAERFRAMRVDPGRLSWPELALRFAAFAPGVTCAVVGTTRLDHLQQAVRHVGAGPLPPAIRENVRAAFREAGAAQWRGRV